MPDIRNGVNVDDLMAAIEAVKMDAADGRLTFTVNTKWKGGFKGEHTTSSYAVGKEAGKRAKPHTLSTDEPNEVLGTDTGSLIMGGTKGIGAELCYAWPIARFAVEASGLDYREVYGKGIEEDAYEGYLNRSRERIDVFEVARSWTAQVVDEIIEPKDTRKKIIAALQVTRNKQEKLPRRAKGHGTAPT